MRSSCSRSRFLTPVASSPVGPAAASSLSRTCSTLSTCRTRRAWGVVPGASCYALCLVRSAAPVTRGFRTEPDGRPGRVPAWRGGRRLALRRPGQLRMDHPRSSRPRHRQSCNRTGSAERTALGCLPWRHARNRHKESCREEISRKEIRLREEIIQYRRTSGTINRLLITRFTVHCPPSSPRLQGLILRNRVPQRSP